MTGVDTNMLIYASRRDSSHFAAAAELLESLANGPDPWAVPWPCIAEFLSAVTRAGYFNPPTAPGDALRSIEAWTESPTIRLISEVPGSWPIFADYVTSHQLRGPRVHDARIAAICVSNKVTEFWTADRDFERFTGLNCRNPLRS